MSIPTTQVSVPETTILTNVQRSNNGSVQDPIVGFWRNISNYGIWNDVNDFHFYEDGTFFKDQFCWGAYAYSRPCHPCHFKTSGVWNSSGNGTYILTSYGVTEHWIFSPSQEIIFKKDPVYSRVPLTASDTQALQNSHIQDPVIGKWRNGALNKTADVRTLDFFENGIYHKTDVYCATGMPCHTYDISEGIWSAQSDGTYILTSMSNSNANYMYRAGQGGTGKITEHWIFLSESDIIFNEDPIYFRRDIIPLPPTSYGDPSCAGYSSSFLD
jgi:hypothetical protein